MFFSLSLLTFLVYLFSSHTIDMIFQTCISEIKISTITRDARGHENGRQNKDFCPKNIFDYDNIDAKNVFFFFFNLLISLTYTYSSKVKFVLII